MQWYDLQPREWKRPSRRLTTAPPWKSKIVGEEQRVKNEGRERDTVIFTSALPKGKTWLFRGVHGIFDRGTTLNLFII